LIRTLYPPTEKAEPLKLDGLAVDIVQECKSMLREPEKSQAMHAVKVLGAFVSTTSMSGIHSSINSTV
jgi:DNA repair/transcription protein MET18/MMS19